METRAMEREKIRERKSTATSIRSFDEKLQSEPQERKFFNYVFVYFCSSKLYYLDIKLIILFLCNTRLCLNECNPSDAELCDKQVIITRQSYPPRYKAVN